MSEDRLLVADNPCPIGRAVDVVGDRWTLLILRHATLGVTRFDEFRDRLGISDNILATRLARLVDTGLLSKVPYRDERRTRHEYRLTERGAELLPVLHALAQWGQEHTRSGRRGPALMKVVHTTCGEQIPFGEYCPHCGREARRGELSWLRPWSSRTPLPLAEPVS